MNELEPTPVQCPYCWEEIELLVDCSVEHQHYVEDCQVCCRPIEVDVAVSESGTPTVVVRGEDE